MLVFVPLSETELAGWARVGSYAPRYAYGVTASLRQAFGFTAADDEDAEHTALHIAGLHGLLYLGRRLVAVAEASARPVQGSEFGEVTVDELPWSAVTALFSDDVPDAAESLRQRLGGSSVASAWDDDEVADFLAEHELLWHGPGEWDSLVGPEIDPAVADRLVRGSDGGRYRATWVTARIDLRTAEQGGLRTTWFQTPTASFQLLFGDVQLGAYIHTDDEVPLTPGDSDRPVALQFWADVAGECAKPGSTFTLLYGDRIIGSGTIGSATEPRHR